MGCNCATQEQINKLYEKYGEKKEVTKKESIKFRIKNFVIKTGVYSCVVFLFPFLFLYVFYKAFDDDKRISVKKFFRIEQKQIGSNVG